MQIFYRQFWKLNFKSNFEIHNSPIQDTFKCSEMRFTLENSKKRKMKKNKIYWSNTSSRIINILAFPLWRDGVYYQNTKYINQLKFGSLISR